MSEPLATVASMKIDCETCTARGASCRDCVVTFLTVERHGQPTMELDDAERAAIEVLASSGLVPPLRLTPRPRLHARPAPPGARAG